MKTRTIQRIKISHVQNGWIAPASSYKFSVIYLQQFVCDPGCVEAPPGTFMILCSSALLFCPFWGSQKDLLRGHRPWKMATPWCSLQFFGGDEAAKCPHCGAADANWNHFFWQCAEAVGSMPRDPLQARYGWPIGHENDLKLLNQMGCQVQHLWSACWAQNT